MEKYFSGQLTQDEFQDLQKLLNSDEDFSREFFAEVEISQTIATKNHQPLKERFRKLDQDRSSKTRWITYAAVLIGLLVLSFLFYQNRMGEQDLYSAYFEPYPDVINLSNRSEDGAQNSASQAFLYYNAGDFEQAAKAFQKHLESNRSASLNFYYGMSLLANGDAEQAIEVFQNYSWKESKSDFTEVVHWYLGLAYLKIKDTASSRLYLEQVAQSDHPLKERATQLLEELD